MISPCSLFFISLFPTFLCVTGTFFIRIPFDLSVVFLNIFLFIAFSVVA